MNTTTTPSYPPAIVARVRRELRKLDKKRSRLNAFLTGPNVSTLEGDDVSDLFAQLDCMDSYAAVLTRRLERMDPPTQPLPAMAMTTTGPERIHVALDPSEHAALEDLRAVRTSKTLAEKLRDAVEACWPHANSSSSSGSSD
jgi:hypothetical protein